MEHSTLSTESTAGRNTNIGPATIKEYTSDACKKGDSVAFDDGKGHRAWLITWNNHDMNDWLWMKEYCESKKNDGSMIDYRLQEEVGKV